MNTIVRHRRGSPRLGDLSRSLRKHSKQAYQNAILTAAESFIIEHGFKQTKVADIAGACGVSVGTLYKYFESKDAVTQAIAKHRGERLEAELGQPFDSDDPLAQLRQWTARVHGYIERYGELLLQLSDTTTAPGESRDTTREWLSQFPLFASTNQRLDELLQACANAGRLRDDIPLAQLAWTIRGLYQSMLVDWYKHPGSFSLIQRGDVLLTLVLQGAMRSPDTEPHRIGES